MQTKIPNIPDKRIPPGISNLTIWTMEILSDGSVLKLRTQERQ